MRERISVLLVEDHALLRKALRQSLDDDADIAVVGEAADGEQAVWLASELLPQVIVMDLYMPVMDGIEATKRILQRRPQTVVVMLSMNSQEACVRKAFAAGVKAYVLKNAVDMGLAAVIKDVATRRDGTTCALSR